MEQKKLRLKLSGKAGGFTLVEVMAGLVISVLSLILLTNFLSNRQMELRTVRRADRFQVRSAVATLQSSELDLHYIPKQGSRLLFYSPTKKLNYSLALNGERLVMRGQNQGFMPILYDVKAGELSFKPPNLKVVLTLHGVTYREKITLSTVKKEEKDAQKSGR